MLLQFYSDEKTRVRRAYTYQSIESCRKILFIKIMFDRVIEEDQNYKHISRKYIHFEMDEMQLNGSLYQLVTATSIEGSQMDARYLTYIRDKNHWLEYNGERVRTVKKAWVQKICVLSLHYRKIGIALDQKSNNRE